MIQVLLNFEADKTFFSYKRLISFRSYFQTHY